MKLEILTENLHKAVSVAAKATNKNLSLPVLGCVLIEATKHSVELRSTNLDLSVRAALKAKVLEEGAAAIPAHILLQTISALSDPKVTLSVSGNTLVIDAERGKTSITLVDPSEFPKLPSVSGGESLTLAATTLSATLRMVAFAASTSSVKPEQASILLSCEKGELVAAATDSFRLAEERVPVKGKGSFSAVLIPARNIADILRSLEGAEEAEVVVGENLVSFSSAFGSVISRTVDGTFPDYRAIIPKDFVSQATCLKEDAVRAFRKVSVFLDSFNQVHLSLRPSEKTFSVRAVNAAVGETIDRIPAVLEGEDMDINFNARYIMDALSIISGDSVSFLVSGPGRPMVLADVPRRGFTYLVMPMNR
jgi:DNA polymerase-3 subunit beta